jgi:cell division protein ZapB
LGTIVPAPASRLTRLHAGEHLKAARTLPQTNRASPKQTKTMLIAAQNLQTACISQPYHLTYQHFSNYSQVMENELDALEGKLAQLIQVSGKLRAENHQLRQELAHALSSSRLYGDKMESAKARLEKLLISLPEDQT